MTVMYPLAVQRDYTELMYSLRSLRYVDHDEVLIVGEKIPDWLTGVTWIQLGDIPGRKQLSIKRKIIAALRVYESILFMNDDVYLLQSWQDVYPYSGDLKHIGESGARPLRAELTVMGRGTKNFDTHSPLVYDRRFVDVVELFSADTIIKSMYCNYLGIEGVNRGDSKINKAIDVSRYIVGRPDISTGPQGVKSVLPVMEEMFPLASKYEIV